MSCRMMVPPCGQRGRCYTSTIRRSSDGAIRSIRIRFRAVGRYRSFLQRREVWRGAWRCPTQQGGAILREREPRCAPWNARCDGFDLGRGTSLIALDAFDAHPTIQRAARSILNDLVDVAPARVEVGRPDRRQGYDAYQH